MYLRKQFEKLSHAKKKEGIFDGPQIRKMFKVKNFILHMNEIEKSAWLSFKSIAEYFLGNHKIHDYEELGNGLLDNYQRLGCLMSVKLHFLKSHLESFPDNLGDYSEEQGEHFHQDLNVMERIYQVVWGVYMMADYCWMLKRET